MPLLTELPAELLHHIFVDVDPRDLGRLPRVCNKFKIHVQGNRKLWQDVYLRLLDKPQNDDQLDWEQALRDVVRLQLICARETTAGKEPELPFVHQTMTQLLRRASSLGHTNVNSNTHSASRNAELLRKLVEQEPSTAAAFLERSFLFEHVHSVYRQVVTNPTDAAAGVTTTTTTVADTETRQRSAHLHCLYGKAIQTTSADGLGTYPYACSAVYDMRGHTAATRWGPFRPDGSMRVDWEKVEAVMVVLGYNARCKRITVSLFSDIWATPFSGSWAGSFLPDPHASPSASPPSALKLADPYGITGTWYRVVCFLDYNDFFGFNFPPGDQMPAGQPRPGINVGEATRLIVLKLHVTKIEDPGPEDGQELPVVHFTGLSRMLEEDFDPSPSSILKGTVRLTREGEVRWTSYSIFNGEERWKSEAIQVGGVRSARGVVGFWFDSDYDAHGPVGPTALWKVSDSLEPYATAAALPPDLLVYSGLLGYGSDFEGEMDYEAGGDDDDEDDEMDEEEEGIDNEALQGELPALLLEANMDIVTIVPPGEGEN
ncbi:F-box domain, Skp2-like protein [Cordyceps fumosorosea ARSEF 2679]|uniref:F-box domain, Skp2-like protein n=1 Tax=Cordyceps fumosorosea (strain ARSEF 2679) TaxID=1081104 RepID=A0A167V7V3_CORFA|nr:F-box domain, Skp2-like protein [Cordyceps fumosorosea ARSEF 2679]OAA62321.1 F-box domain, Skp2-like protein [Cordyceps fumosorosea ARSEF 2679]